jgi:hypothetical protein
MEYSCIVMGLAQFTNRCRTVTRAVLKGLNCGECRLLDLFFRFDR